jgi:ribosomal protein S12 methylthiotransferase accessory factor
MPTVGSSVQSLEFAQFPSVGTLGNLIPWSDLATALADTAEVRKSTLDDLKRTRTSDLVVGSAEGVDPAVAATVARQADVPWIPVSFEQGRLMIGPVVRSSTRGCIVCVKRRHNVAGESPFADADEMITWFASRAAVALLSAQVRAVLFGDPGETACHIIEVIAASLKVQRHTFLPEPLCEVCGEIPDDQRSWRLSRKAIAGESSDGESPTESMLRSTYVDPTFGLVHQLRRAESAVFPATLASVRSSTHSEPELGFGSALNYGTSAAIALLEALERYGGLLPRNRRVIVRGSFRQFADWALDPKSLGLPLSSDTPSAAEPELDDDTELDWVWGYSWGRDRPILVPADVVYYGRWYHERPATRPPLQETSNGCALRRTATEAILFGLLEVVERDAFLMTWYAQMGVPRIDLSIVGDPLVGLMVERFRARLGYDVLAFDTTMEHGIPSVWAMAVGSTNRKDRAKTVSAAAAHIDPTYALRKALLELGPLVDAAVRVYPQHAQRAGDLVRDGALVRSMADHTILYGHPDAFERFNFLLRPVRTPAAVQTVEPPRIGPEWAAQALDRAVDSLTGLGIDVVVADQTTPEHVASHLHCVKVIAPGLLPMTFGHSTRRVKNIGRLQTVPIRLGYRRQASRPSNLNPYPHPFP